jgi:RNA polymerase sigma-70 factor (ECF subfamily)
MTSTDRRTRFDRLFEEHFRALLGYALRRVREPADAADVAAETFLVTWRRLDDVPGRLKARDREVLCLVCWEGLDPSQAAAVVEIPPATARTRLHRARQRMRKELTALGWEPMPALAAAGAPTAVLPLEERS